MEYKILRSKSLVFSAWSLCLYFWKALPTLGRVRKLHPRMFYRCLTHGTLIRGKDRIPLGWCLRTHFWRQFGCVYLRLSKGSGSPWWSAWRGRWCRPSRQSRRRETSTWTCLHTRRSMGTDGRGPTTKPDKDIVDIRKKYNAEALYMQ